jgi:hypothetical protein
VQLAAPLRADKVQRNLFSFTRKAYLKHPHPALAKALPGIRPLPLPSWPSNLVQATVRQATYPSVAVLCREV